ncbi:MAG: SBBP repeat-containing protein [Pyrinomonadaceae bacterium]
MPVIAALIVLGVLAVIFLRPKTQQENAVDDGNAETAAKYAPPEISPASLAEGPRLADPELVSEIRLPALPDGKSAVPRSIAVDSKGYIYIGSVTDGLIRKFDQSGKMLLSWGTQGGANSVFQDLADIVIDKNDTVIALEAEGGKIYFFDTQGKTSRDPVSIPSSYYPRGLTLLSRRKLSP